MYLIVGFGAIFSAWSLLLILSGERQRRLTEALAPPPAAASHSSPGPIPPPTPTPSAKAAPAASPAQPAKTVASRKKN